MFCAFIDITKVFEYVVREELWFKLKNLGIGGNILNIMKSMNASVKSRVTKTFRVQ